MWNSLQNFPSRQYYIILSIGCLSVLITHTWHLYSDRLDKWDHIKSVIPHNHICDHRVLISSQNREADISNHLSRWCSPYLVNWSARLAVRRYIEKVYLGIVVMSIMCLVNNETACLGNDMLLSHDLFFPVDSVYFFYARHVSSTTKPWCSINNNYLANDAIFNNILCKCTIFAPTTDILYPSIRINSIWVYISLIYPWYGSEIYRHIACSY